MLQDYRNRYGKKGYLISGYIRETLWRTKTTPYIELNNIDYILNSPYIPRDVIEKGDKLILYVGHESKHPGDFIEVDREHDYPICYCKDGGEFNEIYNFLINSDLIERLPRGTPQFSLTMSGWERFSKLKHKLPDNKNCFVAMWFNESMERFWNYSIKKAILDTGYDPIRIDKVEHNEKICDRIIREIKVSRFLVADFTGHRGGVYFEAGYAMGLGLPVIWLCEDSDIDKTHFDTRQYNHVVYSSEEDLYQKLYDRILATIP